MWVVNKTQDPQEAQRENNVSGNNHGCPFVEAVVALVLPGLLLQLDLDASPPIILLLLASKEEEGHEEVLLSFSFFPFCPDQKWH